MQDIVKQIVDMDRKAREITAAVEQDRLNSEKEIAQNVLNYALSTLQKLERLFLLVNPRNALPLKKSGRLLQKNMQIYHENWTSFTAKRVTNGLITSLHK